MTAHDPRIEAMLKALSPGQKMWLRATGRSLWPLVFDGDSLHVERSASLVRGDVALIIDDHGRLVAHLVHSLEPVVTMSSTGTLDAPAVVVLGRVVAIRRGSLTVPVPRAVFRSVPVVATVLKRVPGLRGLVRLLRD